MAVGEAPAERIAICEWIEPGLREIPGQDPLGLQTITTDRILPGLLPGVLALSVRARYFSFYAFLLRRYEKRGGRADNQGLDDFVRHREFELCVAANLCPRCSAESAIGNSIVRGLVEQRPPVYERQRSIKTELGGYGLYYRSPMEELGVVVRRGGAIVGETPNPVDVLDKTPRAAELAQAYEEAVADTRWCREWMHGVDPIPADVLGELAEAGCLCRLADHPRERQALRDLFLTPPSAKRAEPTEQRRRAFGLLLDLAKADPEVLESDSRFRDSAVRAYLQAPQAAGSSGEAHAHWAAVVMRECAQDTLSSIWHQFCQAGLAAQGPTDGLTSSALDEVVIPALVGAGATRWGTNTVTCAPDDEAAAWMGDLIAASADLSWEDVRETASQGDALAGLAAFVILCARIPSETDASAAWLDVARVDGDYQPGLLHMAALLRRHLDRDPTVGELMRWVVDNFIISVHESVAMAKLPNSTFRFYWEDGLLRFVDNGVWRFEVSGLRRHALASIAHDLGWWSWQDDGNGNGTGPAISPDGEAVVTEVFGA